MNDDNKYKKFFYNNENLENVYNILKGDEKQLKKETVKKLIQDFEGVEYDELKDDNNKNSSSASNNEENSTANNNLNSETNSEEKANNSEYITFEEFCSIFQKIYENSQNPEKIFLEGYCYMDKDKKSYLDIEDLKRVNKLLNQHFTDDELEGLLELAGKSDGKITFENFTDFLNSEN